MKTIVFPFLSKFILTAVLRHRAMFIALLAVFLLIGCSEPNEDFINLQFIPVGEWKDDWGGGYNITNTTLEYYTEDSEWEGIVFPGVYLKGRIDTAIDFSHNSGVLLIKIEDEDNMYVTVGNYTAVYYKDYKLNHVLFANPIDTNFSSIETTTLNEAIKIFTIDNVGTHVQVWGSGYTKWN